MRTLDARGHHCPVPTLKLRRVMAEMPAGEVLTLLADDPMARIDVPHFCAEAGYELVSTEIDGKTLTFTVRKPAAPLRPAADGSPGGPD